MQAPTHDGLHHFVDRTPQLALFDRLLGTAGHASILFVHGALGIGKSALLQKLRAEHCAGSTLHAWLDFQNEELYTPQAVIDSLCDQLGGEFAATISDALVALERTIPFSVAAMAATAAGAAGGLGFSPAPAQAVQVEATVQGVAAQGTVAIGAGITQFINSPINVTAGMDLGRLQLERQRRLNGVVRAALADLAGRGRVILFLDACDLATHEVLFWLRDYLLAQVRQGRIQPSSAFVVALTGDFKGARGAWLHTVAEWHDGKTIYVDKLGGLAAADVQEYWSKHRQLTPARLPAALLETDVPPNLLVGLADLEQLRGAGRD